MKLSRRTGDTFIETAEGAWAPTSVAMTSDWTADSNIANRFIVATPYSDAKSTA
jgi:hypothetical protein